jgi:hypothetical protein
MTDWHDERERAERDLRRVRLLAAWCIPILTVLCVAVLASVLLSGHC